MYPPPSIAVVDSGGDTVAPRISDINILTRAARARLGMPLGSEEPSHPSYELPVDQFRIENTAWVNFVKTIILRACEKPLGFSNSTCRVEPFQLLSHGVGGQFTQQLHACGPVDAGSIVVGTLVPGHFEGGELTVQAPTLASGGEASDSNEWKPHIWDPAANDLHAVKYAAFYGGCPLEGKPVTKGSRVCVVYRIVATACNHPPAFGKNHGNYTRLKRELGEFFSLRLETRKRPRGDEHNDNVELQPLAFSITDAQTHARTKLVYLLGKRSGPSSFHSLKNRDARAAASLAKFCEESGGAFSLYMCTVKFEVQWQGTEDAYCLKDKMVALASDSGRTLELQSPLIEYGGVGDRDEPRQPEKQLHVGASSAHLSSHPFGVSDIGAEVVPVGFFDKPDFKFDSQTKQQASDFDESLYEGEALYEMQLAAQATADSVTITNTYRGRALVVVTLEQRAQWQFLSDPSWTLREWVAARRATPAIAKVMASGISRGPAEWSLVSPEGLEVLAAVSEMQSLDAVRDILLSCETVEFQPKLRELVQPRDLVEMVRAVSTTWIERGARRVRNRVNIVASLLHGETNAAVIKTALYSVELQPTFHYTKNCDAAELSEYYTKPEEYARVLVLAAFHSVDSVMDLLRESDLATLVLILAPATVLFAKAASKSTPLTHRDVAAIVRHVHERLLARLPRIRNLPYSELAAPTCLPGDKCVCWALRQFLIGESESALFKKESFAEHELRCVAANRWLPLTETLGVASWGEDHVVVAKTYDCKLFLQAQQHLRALGEFL